MFNWTQTVAAHMLPSKRVNGSGFSPCAEHEFYLLSTASVLQMELDYLCQTVKNRKLKLCQEFGIDLNLRKAANSDLIEDEFQMELITKLCTHELLYWRKLLLTSINMSACTAAADNLTLPHTIADKLPSSATEPLQKSSEETV